MSQLTQMPTPKPEMKLLIETMICPHPKFVWTVFL